jgi:hypothetical protein
LELSGAGDLTVSASGTVDLSGVTVSSHTGTLTINDSAGADTITGTDGDDMINATTGGSDIINAGDGDDTITIGHAVDSIDGGSGSDVLHVTGDADLSATTITGIESMTVAAGVTLTLSTGDAAGMGITGDGGVIIKNLESVADADLSGITVNGTVSATSSGNVTFTGKLGKADLDITGSSTFTASGGADLGTGAITVESGSTLNVNNSAGLGSGTVSVDGTLNADAAKVAGKTLDGSGTVELTNLEGVLTADLNTITTTTLNADWSGSGTFSGDLNHANLKVSSGTMSIDSTATLSSVSSITVDGGATLNLAASHAHGESITNSGTVHVTDLDTTPGADLSGITGGILNATWDGTGTLTGNLGTANLTVDSGTMSIGDGATIDSASSIVIDGAAIANATKISGDTISGSGTMTVENLQAKTDADFSAITVDTLNLNWASGDATYSGDLSGADSLSVAAGAIMRLDGAKLHETGLTLGGAGELRIQAATSGNNNFGSLTNNMGTSAILVVASSVALAASDDLGALQYAEIADGKSLELEAAHLDGKTFTLDTQTSGAVTIGSGSVDVYDFGNLSKAGGGTISLQIQSDLDLSGKNLADLPDRYEVDTGSTLTLDNTQVSSKEFELDGGGALRIEGAGAATDLDTITKTDGTIELEVSGTEDLSAGAVDMTKVDKVIGSSAADTVTLGAFDGGEMALLDGNDRVTVDFSNLSNLSSIDGGSGIDTAHLDASAAVSGDSAAGKLSHFEVIEADGWAAGSSVSFDTIQSWAAGNDDGGNELTFETNASDGDITLTLDNTQKYSDDGGTTWKALDDDIAISAQIYHIDTNGDDTADFTLIAQTL